MIKKLYFLLSLLLSCLSVINAQTINFQDTKGELTVDGSGAANYKVPIALPPGIKDVAPQIALTYSSSGSNGIAGYGWNIVGISAINRVGTRIDLDGGIDPVDFDNNDQFSLEGQRLIKLGNNLFGTENLSNMKISAIGNENNPTSFKIDFPDGSIAYYGNTTDSKSFSEYLISKWIDINGNYIKYEYSKDNNVTYISKIIWSDNEKKSTNYLNIIEFKYKNKSRYDIGFINGNKLINTKILDYINVTTGGSLFKKYQLYHTQNELNYQFVEKIQEFNQAGEAANPVIFTYEKSENGYTAFTQPYLASTSNKLSSVKVSGDFDGNGEVDFVSNGEIYLNPINNNNWEAKNLGFDYKNLLEDPIITVDGDKKLQQNSMAILLKDKNSATIESLSYKKSLSKVTTDFSKRMDLKTTDDPSLFEPNTYQRGLYVSCDFAGEVPIDNPKYKESTKTLIGDFNGDGLSETIITHYEKEYHAEETTVCEDYGAYPHFFVDNVSFYSGLKTYMLSLNPKESSSFDSNGFIEIDNNINIADAYVFDFDGDGKDDVISINYIGAYTVKTFNYKTINNKVSIEIETLASGTFPEVSVANKTKSGIVWGDFNGDGRADLMIPHSDGNSNWSMYLSKGNSFEKHIYENFELFQPSWQGAPSISRVKLRQYRSIDINKDGKSDFVMNEYETLQVSPGNRNGRGHLYLKQNLGVDSNGKIIFGSNEHTQVNSDYGYHTQDHEHMHFLIGEFGSNQNSYGYAFIQGNQIWKGGYKKDQSKDARIVKVNESNGTITTDIVYEPLKPNASNGDLGDVNGTYYSSFTEKFPYVEIKQFPSLYVVRELKVNALGKSKKRLFKYFGLTSHSQGLGILGFKKVAQSSWIVDGINNTTPVWNVSQMDPSKRGATSVSWAFSGTNINLIDSYSDSNLLSKTTNNYTYTTLPDKRFILLPQSTIENDFISGVTTTTTNTYDSYYNIATTTETKTANGQTFKSTTTNTVENSPTSSPYIIGRLIKEVNKVDAYGDSYTSQKEYTYDNNKISKTKTTVQNEGIQVVDYTYDTYGNVLTITDNGKIISGLAERIAVRKIENIYDSNGRFVIKKKDIEGYDTNLEYNLLGQVTKETNKFGAVTSTEYDKWGKLLKVTLSNSSTTPIITQYQYNRDNNGWSIISFSDQTKAYKAQYFDAVGNNIKNTIKGFSDGQYVSTSTEYDFLGRKLRESQPYFSSPSQWRTYEYDHLLRPIKITNHTGLILTNSYNGLSATTVEGVRSKKITKDAVGNTAQLVDNGTETINYTYYPNGGVKTTTYGSHIITTGYDVWGRRTSLLDPSVSSIPYTYSFTAFDEIKEEKMPEGTTTYKYNAVGKITEKTTTGKSNISIKYTYDDAKKGVLNKEYGTNEGNSFSNDIIYDNYFRIVNKNEVTPKFVFGKQFVYDEFGRIMNSESWTMTNNKRVQTVILNHQYNQYNGELNLLLDISKGVGKVVWKANTKNERGQTLNATLGELITVENTYDAYGNITNIRNKKGNDWLYNVNYEYQIDRGLLTKRTDSHFAWEENFTYDSFDRLLSWSSPNGTNYNTYLTDGRIDINNQVGKYTYNSTAKYKKESIQLNAPGSDYYARRKEQNITYDAFKRPLSISEEGRGNVNFQYGINGGRFYALKQDLLANKTTQKYYSQDGTMDISVDQVGNTKIINYISSPYETPLIYVTELNSALTTTKESFHYLARDFQGSVMAIYDANAKVIERRLFDPWGNIVKVQDANGNVTEGENAKLIFLDRGYTGHEHFTEVGIIHMNGRIYAPVLKQFLSPDNFIQDPENSQSYNRYGYAWNNPLKYCDPSGEEFVIAGSAVLAAMVVGAVIGGVVYTGMSLYYGDFSWGGLLKNIVIGAVSGAYSSGIGTAVQGIAPISTSSAQAGTKAFKMIVFLNKAIRASVQAYAHGISQAAIQGISGGNAGQSFFSGVISSVIGSAIEIGNVSVFSNQNIDILLFGTVSGGITSELTGGNFWEGAAIGLFVSGLNHAIHNDNDIIYSEDGSEGPGKGNNKDRDTRSHKPAPKKLPGFPDAEKVKGKGGRSRWKTKDGKILEWDKQHGDVEVYNKNGKHLGSARPEDGIIYKPPVNGRTIEKFVIGAATGYMLIKAVDYIGGRVSFFMSMGISSTLMTMPYTNTTQPVYN
ncbi:colicin E3/pyocin S6 family cytotoxin [Empedobacter brevis]|uniref:colicin E3/pyocin S6 family cytotoxin n=1 Tax=Empedobacter brevis TaxID=247 RepID=UPI0033404299